ncbi:uncharacterized protein [Maniola hyperantus]|uniref:uncharacterized protein n=1 Tax=Aphantopus hyperantus TaxID=2795564 RepID=UPI0037496926
MVRYELRLLLGAALLLARLPASDAHDARLPTPDAQRAQDDDDDDDSDPAPFMIVLEHEDGWQCAASLVSLRTGVTTARCARGRGEAPGAQAPWALAAALLGARGVTPAAGARRVARIALAGDGRDPADPARDLAVLELEAPFGRAARALPILLQTDPGAAAESCHAVRALPPRAVAGPRVRFRVRSLHSAPERDCAARVSQWAATRAHLLCLAADDGDMCERDLGGGVVCGGKLSGVLSALGGAGACSATLAAQAVARARRFLHCAHTLRLCGRVVLCDSGACASQCTERRLLPDDDDPPAPASSHPTDSVPPAEDAADDQLTTSASVESTPAAPSPALLARPEPTAATLASPPESPRRTSLATIPFFGDEHASSARHALEFEPNRPDFKAGEYGDNAADYAADDARPPPRAAHETTRPPPTPTRRATGVPPTRRATREPAAPALQLASSEPPQAAASAQRLTAPTSMILFSMTMLFGK